MSRPMHPALVWHLSPLRARLALATHARLHTLALLTLTGVGFALRLGLLDTFSLREDEAIYGYWARAALTDPFFLHVWPDKPPLFIWLLTSTFALLGASEATARLVSIFAATLTIPLVALGAQRLWHSQTAGVLAALLVTFNPFAVSFAPTAYTDSLLVLLGIGALVAALGGHGLGAGVLLAAACMTKQQGLLYAPPVVLLLCIPFGLFCHPERSQGSLWGDSRGILRYAQNDKLMYRGWAKIGWMLLGVALVTLPIVWWDSQRWAVAPSPWALAQQTYAPLAWLPPQQWLERWHAWSKVFWYLGGNATVWTALALALSMALILAVIRVRCWVRVALLLSWGLAFIALHLVTTVQVWDRYLLPLAPWLAWLASGPPALIVHRPLPGWIRALLLVLLVAAIVELVPVGVQAARGQLPIGGDHGDYTGLREAVAWVQTQCAAEDSAPGDSACPAILYHQLLGWHFRFYLYDELQPDGHQPARFDLRWFPSATYLADNAAKNAYPPKYLIVPEWAIPSDLELQLALRGLALERRLRAGRFAVIEIVQPPRPRCEWCQSSLPDRQLPFAPSSPLLPVAPQMSTP